MKYYIKVSKDFKNIKEYDSEEDLIKDFDYDNDMIYFKLGQSETSLCTGLTKLMV